MTDRQKAPAFQFFAGDWLRDEALRSCSKNARATWIDMLCLMHLSQERGKLLINGRPPTDKQLANMLGRGALKAIAELGEAAVFSRDNNGVIYSRRMVRDERISQARRQAGHKGAEHGPLGGRPDLPRQTTDHLPRQTPQQNNPPASASASAEVREKPLPPRTNGHAQRHGFASPIPQDFEPDQITLVRFKTRGWPAPTADEVAGFVDFFTSIGLQRHDWQATFRHNLPRYRERLRAQAASGKTVTISRGSSASRAFWASLKRYEEENPDE